MRKGCAVKFDLLTKERSRNQTGSSKPESPTSFWRKIRFFSGKTFVFQSPKEKVSPYSVNLYLIYGPFTQKCRMQGILNMKPSRLSHAAFSPILTFSKALLKVRKKAENEWPFTDSELLPKILIRFSDYGLDKLIYLIFCDFLLKIKVNFGTRVSLYSRCHTGKL